MKVKGSKNDACSRLKQNLVDRSVDRRCGWSTAQSTGVYDVHRHGPVDRPVDRGKGTVDRSG